MSNLLHADDDASWNSLRHDRLAPVASGLLQDSGVSLPAALGHRASRSQGALQGPVLRAATWNVSSAFARWQELADLAANLDVLVLQEVGVSSASAASMLRSARCLGCTHIYFSAFLRHGSKHGSWLSIWTRAASRRLALRLVTDPLDDRHLAILLYRPGRGPLLLVGCYAHASDSRRRHLFLDELIGSSLALGLDTLFLGDWNQPAEDFGVARYLACGALRVLDDDFDGHPFATSAGGHALDYGLASPRVVPCLREQFATTSDHQLVQYSFPWFEDSTPLYTVPARRPFLDELPAERVAVLLARLQSTDLTSFTLDGAWTLLSDWAEDTLCDEGRGVRRSCSWHPLRRRAVHHSAPCGQSVRLRQLLRLRRKLAQLAITDTRDLRRTATSLAHALGALSWTFACIRPFEVHLLAPELERLLSCQLQSEAIGRLRRWQARVNDSLSYLRRWVRTSAATLVEPAPASDSTAPLHPSELLSQQEAFWLSLWNRAHPGEQFDTVSASRGASARVSFISACEAHLSALNQWIGPQRGGERACGTSFSTDQLLRQARRMRGKAAGADCWAIEPLLRLPRAWWDGLTALWNRCLVEGSVPRRWTELRICLIPKPGTVSDFRPLAIASVLWRLGSALMARTLAASFVQSGPGPVCGAVPGRSLHHIVLHLMSNVEAAVRGSRPIVIASQDISKCYDSLHIGQVLAAAYYGGAPVDVLLVLRWFYSSSARILQLGGTCSSRWHSAKHGLLQGCGCSPILLAFTMAGWARAIESVGLRCSVFLDDRAFWSIAECRADCGWDNSGWQQCVAAMRRAKTLSDSFDGCYGLRVTPHKCHIASTTPWRLPQLDDFGYASSGAVLELLGLRLSLLDFSAHSYLRFDIDLALRRLARIRVSSRIFAWSRLLVRSLVLPMFTWAAGFVRLPAEALRRLRQHVLGALFPWRTARASPCLLWMIAGAMSDPCFVQHYLSLRALLWLECQLDRDTLWRESLPLACLTRQRTAWLPALELTFHDLHWWCGQVRGELVVRGDLVGCQPFRLGYDHFKVLQHWLERHWCRRLFQTCRAFGRRLARARDGVLAVGPGLPAPPRQDALYAQEHIAWFHDCSWESPEERHLAVGDGLDCWYWQRRSNCGGRPLFCFCGGREPSAAHLLWSCPATQRPPCRGPRNAAEEKLWCPTVRCEPPPHAWALDFTARCDALVSAFASHCPAVLALDGAARDGWASWGIAWCSPAGFQSVGGPVGGPDCSSSAAELCAVSVLVAALQRLLRPHAARLVLVDSRSVVDALRHGSMAPRTPLAGGGV